MDMLMYDSGGGEILLVFAVEAFSELLVRSQ